MSDKPKNSASLTVRPEVEPMAMPGVYGVLESVLCYPETVSGFKAAADGVPESAWLDDPEPETGSKIGYAIGKS